MVVDKFQETDEDPNERGGVYIRGRIIADVEEVPVTPAELLSIRRNSRKGGNSPCPDSSAHFEKYLETCRIVHSPNLQRDTIVRPAKLRIIRSYRDAGWRWDGV